MNDILKKHYEDCLDKHGPNHRGMDWPNPQDAEKRYEVMKGIFDDKANILDLGCGAGLFVDYLQGKFFDGIYVGVDISEAMVKKAEELHPFHGFFQQDVLAEPLPEGGFDYVIMNGLLTMRASNTQEQMWDFARKMILAAFKTAKIGIAFNVMSKHVDWERDDLFHAGFDEMTAFLKKEVSRHIVIRADYGLWEYTVYCYKDSQ